MYRSVFLAMYAPLFVDGFVGRMHGDGTVPSVRATLSGSSVMEQPASIARKAFRAAIVNP